MEWACHGQGQVFFADVWPNPDTTMPDPDALEVARAYCRYCPARRECYEMAVDYEGGCSERDRHGVWAYLTPSQRKSIQQRGTARCRCGAVRDPLLLAKGTLTCPVGCGAPDAVGQKVHDHGDEWTPRHTELAREVVALLVDTVEVGGVVPPPGTLARTMDQRANDMRRIYQSLLADSVITRTDGRTYRREAPSSVMRSWVPAHLTSHPVC